MNTVVEETRLEELLGKVIERLTAMEQRMHEMEARFASPAPKPQPVAPKEEAIADEILMVIAAAVAAFMGKKARIRRVRRMTESGVNPWSQQGRVSIQASHNVQAWSR